MAESETLRCTQVGDPYKALGLATSVLSKVKPYAGYKFGGLVGTVLAEIRRGHYVFTLEGNRIVGYAGWALCDPEVAAAWVEGRRQPSYEQCVNGSNPVLVTFHSKSRAATFAQIRHMRRLYPGREVLFRRDYAGERHRSAKVLNVIKDPAG